MNLATERATRRVRSRAGRLSAPCRPRWRRPATSWPRPRRRAAARRRPASRRPGELEQRAAAPAKVVVGAAAVGAAPRRQHAGVLPVGAGVAARPVGAARARHAGAVLGRRARSTPASCATSATAPPAWPRWCRSGTSAAYFFSVAVTLWPHVFMALGAMPYYETAAVVITLVAARPLARGARARPHLGGDPAAGEPGPAHRARAPRRRRDRRPDRGGATSAISSASGPASGCPSTASWWRAAPRVDESMLTGESLPVEKAPGAVGLRRARSTAPAASSSAPPAWAPRRRWPASSALVEEAQGSRAPIQRLADRVAAVFVPVVLVIAALTFAGWWLVGPAPALAATRSPTRWPCWSSPARARWGSPRRRRSWSAPGEGAEHGVLIKSAAALERLQRVRRSWSSTRPAR